MGIHIEIKDLIHSFSNKKVKYLWFSKKSSKTQCFMHVYAKNWWKYHSIRKITENRSSNSLGRKKFTKPSFGSSNITDTRSLWHPIYYWAIQCHVQLIKEKRKIFSKRAQFNQKTRIISRIQKRPHMYKYIWKSNSITKCIRMALCLSKAQWMKSRFSILHLIRVHRKGTTFYSNEIWHPYGYPPSSAYK